MDYIIAKEFFSLNLINLFIAQKRLELGRQLPTLFDFSDDYSFQKSTSEEPVGITILSEFSTKILNTTTQL